MKMAATINHILGKCIISIISGNFDWFYVMLKYFRHCLNSCNKLSF
jgi:hypothetical protein